MSELSHQLRQLSGQLPDDRPLAPAKALLTYAARQVEQGDLKQAVMGLDTLCREHLQPVPQAARRQLEPLVQQARALAQPPQLPALPDKRAQRDPRRRATGGAPSPSARRVPRPAPSYRAPSAPPSPSSFGAPIFQPPMVVQSEAPASSDNTTEWLVAGLVVLGLGAIAVRSRSRPRKGRKR